ncbi:hypothetical protein [Pseudocnuella soli]|uniref:hypothetical protein n=1 Tax=Pseudocnuella soli TaxID=2502779 RepID=UPI0010502FAE|nr:hypothetical protein [Pseudocnuella soli]
MHVSGLIESKEYRDFLSKRFPITLPAYTRVAKYTNVNPSLTGNAFEILFELVNHSKSNLKKQFEVQFKQAEEIIADIQKVRKIETCLGKEYSFIKLSKEDYKSKVGIVKQVFSETCCISKEKKLPVKFLEISSSVKNYFPFLGEVRRATSLLLYPYNGLSTIIYEADSVAKYYKGIQDRFLTQAETFRKDRQLTRSFVKTILLFAHISHPFFIASEPLKNVSLDVQYINQTFKHFSLFFANSQTFKGKLIRKPSFACHGILATPDFLYKNKIIEVKTSQKFSRRDYLQGLSYLLFAQFPENRSIYGKIDSVVIYYSKLNQQITIHLKDLEIDSSVLQLLAKEINRFRRSCLPAN